jgi:hypothetical protein
MFGLPGQCCEGAASVKSKRNGLKSLILEANPRASYVHCYAHSLQLGVQDAVKDSQLLSNALDLCSEVASMIRKSPKRARLLSDLKQEIKEPSIGIRSLCPTRSVAVKQILRQFMEFNRKASMSHTQRKFWAYYELGCLPYGMTMSGI